MFSFIEHFFINIPSLSSPWLFLKNVKDVMNTIHCLAVTQHRQINKQYGVGASATIDHNDTRRGGLIPMTTVFTGRPKVEQRNDLIKDEVFLLE